MVNYKQIGMVELKAVEMMLKVAVAALMAFVAILHARHFAVFLLANWQLFCGRFVRIALAAVIVFAVVVLVSIALVPEVADDRTLGWYEV